MAEFSWTLISQKAHLCMKGVKTGTFCASCLREQENTHEVVLTLWKNTQKKNNMLLIILPPVQAEFDLDKLSHCMSAVYEIYPAWRQTDKK